MDELSQDDLLNLDEILHAFGVSEWRNMGPLEESANVAQILVEIQGERYVLRERAHEMAEGSETNAQHRAAFSRYLLEAGIPVPQLLLTPQGQPFVTIGEDTFELQQYVEGEPFPSTDQRELERIASAGTMLAQFHQASRLYMGPQYRWPGEAHAGGLVQGWLHFARSKAEQVEIYAISSALLNMIEQWEAALPSAMMSIGSARGIPEFHIHGDYHPLNLRFHQKHVSAVLGLDASRWEKRLIDLACALFYFSALNWHDEMTRPLMQRGFHPERTRAFLEAYSTLFPPYVGEAQALVDALLLMTPILSVNGPLEDIFYLENTLELTPIDDILERIHWATTLPGWLQRLRRTFAEMWQQAH
jgi:Ser/Thr protein kinase RdoA (MazF antagonist)